jgi:hypothetical protein
MLNLKNSIPFLISRYFSFPFGFLSLLVGVFLLFNFKSCSSEVIDFKNSVQSAEENFMEGTIEARSPLLKTAYSGTNTIAYYQEEKGEIEEKSINGKLKKKNGVISLNSSVVPFLMKSKNNYIYFGLYGKDFFIDHGYDYINNLNSKTQLEKHIYDKDYISIYTEKGDLRYPDSVKTSFIFYRGKREDWLSEIQKRIDVWNEKIKLSYYLIYLGTVLILGSIIIRYFFKT